MAVATTPSDIDLLQDARAGDQSAFTELYVRHRTAALRVAQCYGANGDAEDMVNTAFERVMAAVRRGGGPVEAFRPYLYVTIRHLAMERSGHNDHQSLDDVPEAAVAVSDLPAVDAFERALVLDAFAALPDRWQAVLWQVAVEGRPPREVARNTGLPPNTVAVLAHRARERLRQTYLQAHVQSSTEHRCAPHRARLGTYGRGGLSARQRAAAEEHLATCGSCARLVGELDDVNRLLARAVVPAFAVVGDGGLSVGAGAGAAGTAGLSVGAGGSATGAAVASGATAAAGISAGVGAAVVTKLATMTAAALFGVAVLGPHEEAPSRDRPTVEVADGVVADLPHETVQPSPPAPDQAAALVAPVPAPPERAPHADDAFAPLPSSADPAALGPTDGSDGQSGVEPEVAMVAEPERERGVEPQVESPAPPLGDPGGEADVPARDATGPAPTARSTPATTAVPADRTTPAAEPGPKAPPTADVRVDRVSGTPAAASVSAQTAPPDTAGPARAPGGAVPQPATGSGQSAVVNPTAPAPPTPPTATAPSAPAPASQPPAPRAATGGTPRDAPPTPAHAA